MQNFILRDIDPRFWAKVKSKAALEGRTLKADFHAAERMVERTSEITCDD